MLEQFVLMKILFLELCFRIFAINHPMKAEHHHHHRIFIFVTIVNDVDKTNQNHSPSSTRRANFCLNPGGQSRLQGTEYQRPRPSLVPKFFGLEFAEGVRRLGAVHPVDHLEGLREVRLGVVRLEEARPVGLPVLVVLLAVVAAPLPMRIDLTMM